MTAKSINGFSVSTSPSQISYILTQKIDNDTYYIFPGNSTAAISTGSVIGIPFSQRTIVYSMSAYLYSSTGTGRTGTINLYNSTTSNPTSTANATKFATTNITANSNPILIQNFSSTFNSSSAGSTANYLICELTTTANIGTPATVMITLSTY